MIYLMGCFYLPDSQEGYDCHASIRLFAYTILPAFDAITDLLYLLLGNFYNTGYLVSSTFFFSLPVAFLAMHLYHIKFLCPRFALLATVRENYDDFKKNLVSILSIFWLVLLTIDCPFV